MIPSLIYTGSVRHRRYYPLHQFTYRLFMFCFDINQIEETFKAQKLVSIEKFNWFYYQRKNYLDGSKLPLDEAARALISKRCEFYPKGKIYLLTHLTCLGYCFNPISLYFVFAEHADQIEALIIEVKNTPWMEKHIYVEDLRGHQTKENIYSFVFQKELHVSPFMAMNYSYKFNFKIDEKHIIVHMESLRDGVKHFDATLSLQTSHKTPQQLLGRFPLMTYKVTAAIYWQAFKLWVKGVPFHSHPDKK